MKSLVNLITWPFRITKSTKKEDCGCGCNDCGGKVNKSMYEPLNHGSRLDLGVTGLEGYNPDPTRSPLDGAYFDNQFIR